MSAAEIFALIKRYRGVIAVYFAIMLTVLDGTIVNVALPTLTQVFGSGASSTVWIVNSYQLMITMLLLSMASVGDIYGYKRVFLIGVVVFTVSSALCATAQALWMLVIFRVLQGIGAASIMSVNIALVRMIYPADKLGRGLGFNAMVVSLSTVMGPTLAGSLLAISSWHWLFLINVPVGAAAFFLGRRYLPENPVAEKRKFDLVSALMCAAILGLLVNAVDDFSVAKVDWRIIVAEFVAIVALGYAVVRRQRGRANPLLPVDLLRIPLFAMSICTSVASFCAQMLAMVSLPFLLQDVLGHSALQVGLLMSPWAIGVMVAAPVAGRVVERVHGGLLGAIGMGVCAVGMLMLYLLPQGAGTCDIVWRMLLCGIGFGTFQTPNNVTMAASSPMHRSGAAGGLQGSARVLGQTLGTTLVSLIFVLNSPTRGSRVSLLVGMCVAVLAAVGSALRISQPSSYQHKR